MFSHKDGVKPVALRMISSVSFKHCGKCGDTTGQGQLRNLQDENTCPLNQKLLRNSNSQKSERLGEREGLQWPLLPLKMEKGEQRPCYSF